MSETILFCGMPKLRPKFRIRMCRFLCDQTAELEPVIKVPNSKSAINVPESWQSQTGEKILLSFSVYLRMHALRGWEPFNRVSRGRQNKLREPGCVSLLTRCHSVSVSGCVLFQDGASLTVWQRVDKPENKKTITLG